MNPIPQIKRILLRCLLAADGEPLNEAMLDDAVDQVISPRPLQSDKNQARRELEADGFAQGKRDDLDHSKVTWTLTLKGQHRASQL